MIILASFLIVLYFIFSLIILEKIAKGNSTYLILYIICFLPFYSIFQLLIFKSFANELIVNLIKYSKDLIIFSSFILFFFGSKKTFLFRKYYFSFLDKLVVSFLILVVFYALIPFGEVNILSKMIYAKNILLIGAVYCIGRNTKFNDSNWGTIFKIVISVFLFSFVVIIFEYISGTHLHSYLDYSNFNRVFNDIDPQGNFGLNWSFESQGARPRYASFFADPLEFSSSLILIFVFCFWGWLNSKSTKNKLLFILLIALLYFSFYLALSRASIISVILIIFIGLIMFRKYYIIFSFLLISSIGFSYSYYFSSDEIKYLIIDTLTFQNSSSLGHLVEWIEGVISIYENPFGIGLAMSGNASGVDQSIKIGGENQFLIYGVQMGVISVILYLAILLKSIWNSLYVFKYNNLNKKCLGFVSALIKIGLLIPLFTSNAELYLFVSLFSWYLVGQVESIYNQKHHIIEKN